MSRIYPLNNRTCKAATPRGMSEEGVVHLQCWMLSAAAWNDSNSWVMTRCSVITRPATATT